MTSIESEVESMLAASTTEGLSAAACELPIEQKSIRLAVIGGSVWESSGTTSETGWIDAA